MIAVKERENLPISLKEGESRMRGSWMRDDGTRMEERERERERGREKGKVVETKTELAVRCN